MVKYSSAFHNEYYVATSVELLSAMEVALAFALRLCHCYAQRILLYHECGVVGCPEGVDHEARGLHVVGRVQRLEL